MKYTKRKTAVVGSLAAAEIRAVLEKQDPPLGNKYAAEMIGLNYETMRSVVNDSRIPSTGVIYGLARVLKLEERWVKKLLDLRQKDLVQKKIAKAVSSGPGTSDIENFVTILGALNKGQIEDLKKRALVLAVANRAGK